ncbi:MAG TPA: hypothetical protein VFS43_27465 [Polyangiaceae bacterium]|nr:hypothetical protein [Polyangiaceae bacterium]
MAPAAPTGARLTALAAAPAVAEAVGRAQAAPAPPSPAPGAAGPERPPVVQVLVVWPQVLVLEAIVTEVEFAFRRFRRRWARARLRGHVHLRRNPRRSLESDAPLHGRLSLEQVEGELSQQAHIGRPVVLSDSALVFASSSVCGTNANGRRPACSKDATSSSCVVGGLPLHVMT